MSIESVMDYPTISSSVISFSSCSQTFPTSGSFPMSQFFASGGQSIGVSSLASVLPMNIQDWFPFSSVTQSCPTLCDPMDRSTPGLPVHHQLPEFTQTNVYCVGDAIQPSNPLSFLPPAFNLSQDQGLFQWVSSSHQVAEVLDFQLQHQSFPMNTQDWSPLGWTGWISLYSKELSRAFSNTIVQKHQFFGAQLSL